MKRSFGAVALVCLAVPAVVSAQAPNAASRDALLVTTAWLAQHLHDPGMVVLQIGAMTNAETYAAGHIPGARMLDYDAVHALPDTDAKLAATRAALETLGISDSSRIVLYSNDEYWPAATRTLLMLNYVGLQHVQLLDGGLKAWIASGGSLSKDKPMWRRASLPSLTTGTALVADADFVKAHEGAGGFAIVDARDREFYDGVRPGGPPDHRVKGHIPGALSAPFGDFSTSDGHLKSSAEIAALLEKAGVKPRDTVIGYCHVGEQATAMLFAARTLGHRVILYNGSFTDWIRRDLPVELPKQEK